MNKYRWFARALVIPVLLAWSTASIAGLSNMPLPSVEATSSITARELKTHLSFLASDELGGRFTLSQGNRIAARYLASQLESYGYRGAARDGSFFQKVPLGYRSVDLAKSGVTLTTNGQKQELKYADDFAVEKPADVSLSGELVFVGYGISLPANNHDDYAGLDVKGKIVVAATGAPQPLKGSKPADDDKPATALAHGAAGVIMIAPPQLLQMWAQIRGYLLNSEQATLPGRAVGSGKGLPVIYAGPRLITTIATAMGKEEAYLKSPGGNPLQPAPLSVSAEIRMSVAAKEAPPAQNVVGILEGSDPKLKDEYVVFSAHYDHLKTGDNGEVYNGADDDGSGTVSVLEIAEAFSVGPRAKRSVLIVFHTGEEMGLLGSEYNTDYEPVAPLSKLVANFNIDMVGRSRAEGNNDSRDKELADRDSIYVIGADKLSTELNSISEQTNAETARLRFDYTYNDENHPQRFYYRSDHYHYAKHGIPIIFYFTGVHRDYHKPTDDADKIDFERMERVDRMIFATGWRVANLDHRIVVDKKPAGQPR